MARQVNFYLHPDDEPDFDRFLKSFGDVVLVPDLHRGETVTTVPDTLTTNRGGPDVEGSRVFILRPADLASVRLRHVEKHGIWLVDDHPLPALHFDRCILRSDRLLGGRLYFEPHFVRDGRWVEKPEDFVGWADRIVRGARRRLSKVTLPIFHRTKSIHIGPAADAWRQACNAGFRPANIALIAAGAV